MKEKIVLIAALPVYLLGGTAASAHSVENCLSTFLEFYKSLGDIQSEQMDETKEFFDRLRVSEDVDRELLTAEFLNINVSTMSKQRDALIGVAKEICVN